MSSRRVLLPIAVVIFAFAGCESPQPTNPATSAENVHAQRAALSQTGGTPGIPDLPRVRPSIEAHGSFQPGEPITLTAHATARYGASDVQLQVTAPEIQSAKATAFGRHYRLLSNSSIPAVAEWPLGGMSKGMQQTRSFQITVPAPGYYRVYAVAKATPAPGSYDNPFVMNTYVVQRWLLVTEQGGAFLNSFDRSRIPEGAFQGAGPFRGLPPEQPQTQPDQASLLGSLIAKVKAMFTPLSGYYVLHAQWVTADSTGVPVGVTAKNELYHEDTRSGNLVSTQTHLIDSNGYYSLACHPDGSYDIWVTSLRGYNSDAKDEFAHGETELEDYQCGDTFDIEIPLGNYNAYNDLKRVIPAIDDHSGYNRSQILFSVDSLGCGTDTLPYSCYKSSPDRISFSNNMVLDTVGHVWAAGHEYTHALQEESLAGGLWSTSNCQIHYIIGVSSYTCAMQEGFADYLGSIGREAVAGAPVYENWETFSAGGPGDVKGEIEGDVAATLWDLSDSASDGNDSTAYAGTYIGDVFNSCETYDQEGLPWVMNAVDQFVWCLENRVDSTTQANNFPGELLWTSAIENATEPADWSADSIRATWLQNLGN